MPASRPRILLVGPYERDNVGDELFLLVTEHHLAGADVVAAAPFAADATALIDREVPAFGPLLRSEPFDAVWTVGGQVGSLDLERAYRMSAPPADWAAYRAAAPAQRRAQLRAAVQADVDGAAAAGAGADAAGVDAADAAGEDAAGVAARTDGAAPASAPASRGGVAAPPLPVAPYLPAPLEHPLNAGVLTVVNSAGVSGIRHAEASRRAELLGLLRGTDVVVVRDPASAGLLQRHGIDHELVPDAVHALGVQWPAARDPHSDIAVVQVSTGMFAELGLEAIADGLAAAVRAGGPDGGGLEGLRVRFVPAGLATGHDALEDYDRLAAALRERIAGLDVATWTERRPEAIVERIRSARVVLCSSLHVRIVAAAYGVPRVSLRRFKPTRYARKWDPDMPFDVVPEGIPVAIAAALAAGTDPAVQERSDALARQADEQLAGLAERVLAAARSDTPADRAARAERRRSLRLDVLTEQGALQRAEIAALQAEVKRLKGRQVLRRGAARVLRRNATS